MAVVEGEFWEAEVYPFGPGGGKFGEEGEEETVEDQPEAVQEEDWHNLVCKAGGFGGVQVAAKAKVPINCDVGDEGAEGEREVLKHGCNGAEGYRESVKGFLNASGRVRSTNLTIVGHLLMVRKEALQSRISTGVLKAQGQRNEVAGLES